MVMLVGFDDEKQEYKLLNTDVTLNQGVRVCPYTYSDMLFGPETDCTVTDEQLNLGKQLSQLKRLTPDKEHKAEYRILHYSCDYSEKDMLLTNIRVHLIDGSIHSLDASLLTDDLVKTERFQLQRLIEYTEKTPASIELDAVFSYGQETVFCGSVSKEIHNEFYTYAFLINNTNRILPLVYWNYIGPIGFALGLTGFKEYMGKTREVHMIRFNGDTTSEEQYDVELAYTPSAFDASHNKYSVYKQHTKHRQNSRVTSSVEMNKELLESKIFCSERTLSLLDAKSNSTAMKAFDGMEYLISSGKADPYKIQLTNCVIDGNVIMEEIQEKLSPVMETQESLSLYNEEVTTLYVDGGVLKAIIAPKSGRATINLNGIVTIDDYVLEDLASVHFLCSGDFVLKDVGNQNRVWSKATYENIALGQMLRNLVKLNEKAQYDKHIERLKGRTP